MTPFGRQPMTAGLLATHSLAETPTPVQACDKWAVLRDLTAARRVYGVNDRDLAVLAALLSFHPAVQLSDDASLIVFPSNASLSSRVHGMPESTLRRHIAALVQAGLILRRDSPNGKRFARRGASGRPDRAFGFDLRPLALHAPDIALHAQEARDAADELRCQREVVVIGLRDLKKLIIWGTETIAADWSALQDACADLQRALRRKLVLDQLHQLNRNIQSLLAAVHTKISPQTVHRTPEMIGTSSQNERHHHSSNKDNLESEDIREEAGDNPQPIPLSLVLKAAPDICDYAPDTIRTWRDLIAVANVIRPMIGITLDAWQHACRAMGSECAAVTLACLLQRGQVIQRPGAYLRSLAKKAEMCGYSPGPMVMALLRCENRQAF